MRKSFTLNMDLARTVRRLEDAAAGRLFKALYGYLETGVMPDNLEGAEAVCFDVIQNDLDRDAERYEQTRQRRREAGRKGGQVTRERYHHSLHSVKAKPSNALANQAVNDNGNVNENGNVNGNVNGNGNINENVNANENGNGNGNGNQNAAPRWGRGEASSPNFYGR